MEFRQLTVMIVLAAALFCGAKGHAQSEAKQETAVLEPSSILVLLQPEIATDESSLRLSAREEFLGTVNLSATSRPLLFVHGCGGSYADWYSQIKSPVIPLRTAMLRDFPSLYQSNKIYVVWFDGNRVRFADTATGFEIDSSQVSQDARLFVIVLYDPTQTSFSAAINPDNVNKISVSYKAGEMARVVAAIQGLTFVKDVTLVTHSMGGIVGRTYVEGLGEFGSAPYLNNLGAIVSLDAPQSGAELTFFESIVSVFTALPCNGLNRELNRDEINPSATQSIIPTLNYAPGRTFANTVALPIPPEVSIRAIKSYNTDLTVGIGGDPKSDGAINASAQDILLALQGHISNSNSFSNIENSFGQIRFPDAACNPGTYLLHPLLCVGVQPQTVQLLYDGILAYQSGIPLGVNAVSFAGSVTGGASFTGTVLLSAGAPPLGATVALSSNDPSVQVPATLNIPAGIDSATFTLNSSAVGSPKTVSVTASYGRANQNASITLQPAMAQVGLSSTSLNFNTQLIRTRSIGHVLSVTNSGTAPLLISSIFVTGDFEQSNTCIGTFAINASCAINITFKPNTFGLGSGTLTIVDNAPGSPHNIALSGSGIDIVLTLSRPARPHRSAAPSSNIREASFELSVFGGAVAEPVQLSCVTAVAGEGCTLTQMDSTHWRVSVAAQQHRASRLRKAQALEVTVNANLGSGVRSFSIPLQ